MELILVLCFLVFVYFYLLWVDISVAKVIGKYSRGYLILAIFTAPILALVYAAPKAMDLQKEGKWPPKKKVELKEKTNELYTERQIRSAQAEFKKYFDDVTQRPKSRLTEEEYRTMMSMASRAHVVLQPSAQNALNNIYGLTTLEKWGKIIRPVTDGISANLKKDETVYYRDFAVLRKWKTVSQGRSYSGLSFSVPIMKGLRYRVGSFSPPPEKQRYLGLGDEGELLITDKRVIFSGKNSNFSIPLNKVHTMGVNENGLCIQKENAKEPKILTTYQYDMALYVLSTLINEEPISFIGESPQKSLPSPEIKPKEVELKAEIEPNSEDETDPKPEEKKPRKRKTTKSSTFGADLDDLRKLKSLLDDGIITQEEFDAAKKKALGL